MTAPNQPDRFNEEKATYAARQVMPSYCRDSGAKSNPVESCPLLLCRKFVPVKLIASAALLTLTATPIYAQTAPAATAPAAVGTAKFTLDTPIETIAADPAGKAILDTNLGNISTHPLYDLFKSKSLNQIRHIAPEGLTDGALAKVQASLAAIK